MRSVAIIVVRGTLPVDEIHESINTGGAIRAREVVHPAGDPRVNDCDTDTRAVVAQVLTNCRGAHGGTGPFHGTGDHAIFGDQSDPRMVCQRRERSVG